MSEPGWNPNTVYLLLFLVLVVSGLIARRPPLGQTLKYGLAWVAIFGIGFVLFSFRDDFGYVYDRLKTEATGEPMVAGNEMRIPMAADGHFWVTVAINGRNETFLVDSGATMTTLSRAAAVSTGVEVAPNADQMVSTANGTVLMHRGRAQTLKLGAIERSDFAVHVSEQDDGNVLGMNFLSSLKRWGVEGRWLVLEE